jgi:serine protein kinase
VLEDKYGIPRRRLTGLMSPLGGEAARRVRRRHLEVQVVKAAPVAAAPDRVAKTEPGDENNQDISSLVGKVDIRKLEHLSQNDPDAYSYSGGLNRATQGFSNSSRCSRRRSRCCTRC